MSAVPILIADAVAAEINTANGRGAFTTSDFNAKRRYFDWDLDFSDLSGLVVEVVYRVTQPEGSIRLDSASSMAYTAAVDIVIRQRFGPDDRQTTDGRLKNESVDPLVLLLEELHELFVGTRNSIPLDDVTAATWQSSDVLSWVNQAKLRKGLFEGVVRVEFEYQKAI